MTVKQIQDIIMSFTNDVLLDYQGHGMIFINPWSEKRYDLGYKDFHKTYANIEELMNDKIFDGKSLTEIADNITEI